MQIARNPFKFGTVVKGNFFTNRLEEITRINGILNSENHLILIAPRRFGKTSLISKVTDAMDRPVISLDLQLVTSPHDLADQLLKRIYRVYPIEKVRQYVRHFRIVPSISLNPVANSVDVSFNPQSEKLAVIEDVLNTMEKLSRKNHRLVVVFDEFQEITRIDDSLLRQFRSIMQHHQHINYVFLGSQESMIRDIFEKKDSPFYHFGLMISLRKISAEDFSTYLDERFGPVTEQYDRLSKEILEVTHSHPHYTQQLAYIIWEKLQGEDYNQTIVEQSVAELVQTHDNDYERIWVGFNNTDKKMLIALSRNRKTEISDAFFRKNDLGATSTAQSCLKRLAHTGYVLREGKGYILDDPFFRTWINSRREA